MSVLQVVVVAVNVQPDGRLIKPVMESREKVVVLIWPAVCEPLVLESAVTVTLGVAKVATPELPPFDELCRSISPKAKEPVTDEFENGPPVCDWTMPKSTAPLLLRKKAWDGLER